MAAPTVTGASPNNGPEAGGITVTLTGTNFVAGCTVEFGAGNFATSVVIVGPTQITCVTPAHARGYVHIIVTNPLLETGMLFNAHNYYPVAYDPDTEDLVGPVTDVIVGLNGQAGDVIEGLILWPYLAFWFDSGLRDGGGSFMRLVQYAVGGAWTNMEDRVLQLKDLDMASADGPWKITLGLGIKAKVFYRAKALEGVRP